MLGAIGAAPVWVRPAEWVAIDQRILGKVNVRDRRRSRAQPGPLTLAMLAPRNGPRRRLSGQARIQHRAFHLHESVAFADIKMYYRLLLAALDRGNSRLHFFLALTSFA
jgi:hypothetical protein